MADGLNAAQLNELNQSINAQGNAVTGAVNAGAKTVVDGLHEVSKASTEQLVDAVNSIPDQFKQVYELLAQVVENLTSINDLTESSIKKQEVTESKAPNAEKVGISADQKESDVASKVPFKYAAPALMLNKTLISLLGKDSLLFTEIQKITGGQTTKDKLDSKKKGEGKDSGAGKGIAGAAVMGGGALAGFGILGVTLGLIIKSAAMFAQTPFLPALKSVRDAQKFTNQLKKLIKSKEDPWPTKSEMTRFTTFCTSLQVGIVALQTAAKAATKMVIFGPLGTLGLILTEPFINKAQDVIAATNKRQLNIEKFVLFCTNLRTAFSSLFKAAVWAFALLLVVIPGLIGLVIGVKFVNAAINLIRRINQNDITELGPAVLFAEGLAKLFKSIMIAAFWATALLMLGISGIMGAGMAFLFMTLSIKIGEKLSNQAAAATAKGGSLDNLLEFAKKLRQVFATMVITMLFAILAGILAIPATIALIGITVFLIGVSLVGILVKFVKPYVAAFNSVAIELAIAMLIFAIAFLVITNIMTPAFFSKVMIMLVGVTLVLAMAAVIGFLATFALPFIAAFVGAAILLGIGMIILFVGLLVLQFMPINETTLEKLSMIGQFFVIFASYIQYFLIGMVAAIFFAVASVFLMVGFILFTISLILLCFTLGILDTLINEKPPDGAPGNFTAYGGLAMIALFFLEIGMLMPFSILAMIAAIPLVIAAVLLMVSFLALTITFILAAFLLGIFDSLGADLFLIPLIVGAFFAAMLLVAIPAILFIIVAVPILLASVMLLAIFVALTVSFLLAKVLSKSKLEKDEINSIRESIYALYDIFSIRLMLKSLKVVITALPVLAAAVMIMGIMLSLVIAYKAIEKLGKLQNTVDPKIVIDSVMSLMDIVQKAGEASKGMSKKAAEAFAITLGAIVDAIDSMVDIIIKLCYFNTPDGEKQLKDALTSLHKVIDEFFLDETNGVLGILGKLKGINKGQLRAAEALVPITEAISNITDVIIKLKDIEDVDEGIIKVRKLAEFVKELIVLASGFTPEPKGVLGAIGGFFVGNTADSIKSATEVVNLLPDLLNALGSINDSVQGFTALDEASKNVTQMTDFVTELTAFAGTFKKGGFFTGGGTSEEIKTAINVIKLLHPMIDELNTLNNKITVVNNLTESTQKVQALIPLISDLVGIAIFLSSNKDKANKAVDAAKILVNASNELVKVAENIDKMAALKVSLENNIVAPLMELDEPANKLTQVSNAVNRLNSELTKLARENKETLKTISSIGNASGGGLLSFVGNTIGKAFGGGGGQAADPNSAAMAANIAKIQTSVQRLDDKITKDQSTWTAPQARRA